MDLLIPVWSPRFLIIPAGVTLRLTVAFISGVSTHLTAVAVAIALMSISGGTGLPLITDLISRPGPGRVVLS